MTAFDAGWSLLKEWSPDWRRKAAALPLIDEDRDFDFEWGDYDAVHAAKMGAESRDVLPFVHPHDSSFVVKRPHSMKGIDATDRNRMRFRANPFRVALEELGFPVVSEMYRDDGFTVQPRMVVATRDPTDDSFDRWTDIVRKPVAPGIRDTLHDVVGYALRGFARDKHSENIGLDPKGLPRYFDYELGGGPNEIRADTTRGKTPKEVAENWMGALRVSGVELPISRLIDRLPDMTDIERERADEDAWWSGRERMEDLIYRQGEMRRLLELLEPHSWYGTKQVTVDGKAIWGDDW